MAQLPDEILKEIKNYRNQVYEFQKGNIDKADFKKYLSAMGIYEEKQADSYMLRIRIPAGVITAELLDKILNLAVSYGNKPIHFTTRQDIQIHNLSITNTVDLIEKLLEINLIAKGTGGNTVRNIVCSPLSGVSLDEAFDVTEYALKAANLLSNESESYTLPRKFKVGFSNSPSDTANATISDLGFIAKIKDGQKGFELYGAGGLGKNSAAAIKLEDFIPANEFLYYLIAMKKLFNEEGDRNNRNKARLRHVLARLGQEEFKNKYNKKLIEIKKQYKFENIDPISSESFKHSPAEYLTDNRQLFRQKQKDLYSVYIHPENGTINTDNLDKIMEFIKNLDYEPSIRLSNTQGFFVRDLRLSASEELVNLVSEYTSRFNIDNSISCVGSEVCKTGICKSAELLSTIREKFKTVKTEIKSQLPKAYISGCPNSCGLHQIGKIGFAGKIKKGETGVIPVYTVCLGGNTGAGCVAIAQKYEEILAEKIPDFLYELAKLKYEKGLGSFTDFLNSEKEAVAQLIQQFA